MRKPWRAAREGERGPIWFVTTEQTAGRGRRNRAWIAPRGNLASSILEVIDVAPARCSDAGLRRWLGPSKRHCSGQHRSIAAVGGIGTLKFSLKWPNDVLAVAPEARRHCWLEAEAVADGGLAVVVGIGTNVVAAPEGTPTPATSLAAIGVHVGAEDLFAALSDAWAEFRGIWDNGRGFADIRELWLERAAGLGEPVAVRAGATTVEGTFDTIDEEGCLIVRKADGQPRSR